MAKGTPKKAATKAPVKAKAPPKAVRRPKPARQAEPTPEPAEVPAKPSVSERFWHRIGLGAKAKEERAHQRHLEHEAELERRVAHDREARDAEQARLREERKAHAAAQRKADAKAARELARAAKEEDARLRREAEEAKVRAAEEAKARRRAAAQERAAKERAAAEAKAAKAEERRAARQARQEAKAREEELARLQEEAEERRRAQAAQERVEVTLKDARAPVAQQDEPAAEDEGEPEEGEAVEVGPEPGASAPPPAPASEVETQADRVAAELRARRSKPITIDADDVPAPMLPVGRRARATEEGDEAPRQVLKVDPAPPARLPEGAQAPRGLSIPEHFLLLTLEPGWDERRERTRPGGLGGGLTGALLLELVLHGKVRVQRDRFQVTDADVDPAAAAVAARLAEWGDLPTLQAMGELAKWLPRLLPAYKDRMAARGLLEHRAWRHLGLFYRSQTALLDPDAQDQLRNKLARAIAGGGRPDAPTILSLGLLEASGLFGLVVPEGAQAYNRKRLNGLLAGKDVMGYKVDDELKGIQEIAVRTILDNVRVMTVRG